MCVLPKPRKQVTAGFLFVAMAATSFTPLVSEPAHPAWWNDPARGVTNNNAIQNKGVANIGQLKHIATQAHAELEAMLPGGAGFDLPFDSPPDSPDPAWYQNQKKALNLGQLKAVAKPFYDRLNGISQDWVKAQLEANDLTLNVHFFPDANGYFYPWNPSTPVAENYKPANIGQLKLVFALHLRENTDSDSMFDLWEYAMISAHPGSGITDIASLTDAGDIDNDSVSNLEEYQNGLDPFLADSDGDGLSDGFRIGLLGDWNLNGAVGTTVLTDNSLNGLDGELLSGTRIADGISGGAVSLTATQQLRITPAPGQLNVGDNGSDFSVSFWIRLDSTHEPGWNTILQKGNTSSKRTFHLSLNPDGQKLHARLTSSSNVNEGIDTSVHSMIPEEWTHVSYVHNNGQLKLYINGQLDSSATVGQSIANDDPFYIGKSAWLRGVNADFDEIMIHARALSGVEVLALFEVDSDGDGTSNRLEDLAETDSNDASSGGRDDENVDTDGDGLKNNQDADPYDRAVVWEKAPASQYAVIKLGSPANVTSDSSWGYSLGADGHVLMSRDRSDEWTSGDVAPGTEYFETYMWDIATADWSALLEQPVNLRGIGSRVDKQGNVYGRGYGALGSDESGPGIQETAMRWEKTATGWNEAEGQEAAWLGDSFSDEVDTWTAFPELIEVPVDIFGNTGWFGSQSTHGAASGSTAVYRYGTNSNDAFVTASESVDEQIEITNYMQAGEPRGWHAATWTKTVTPTGGSGNPVVTQAYEFGRLMPDQSLEAGTPSSGDDRWKLQSLASIGDDYRPDGVEKIVVWSTTDGSFQSGTDSEGTMSWQESTTVDASKRLGGKINARGEGLKSYKLWRNGKWLNLSELVDSTKWTNVRGVDINSQGMVLAKADEVGGGSAETDVPILLLPVEVVPDYNRDGRIDQADRGKITEANPYRFWVNDDDDKTIEERKVESNDIPESGGADSSDLVLDGIRDLVDFFPLHLDLKQALEILPKDKYKYILKQDDGAIKFHEITETILDQDHDNDGPAAYLKNVTKARQLKSVALKHANSAGSELSGGILDAFKKGEGIIICEFSKETEKPLILEIKKNDGTSVAEIEFPVRASGVEDMYRHVNVRSAAGSPGGRATETGEPSNYPDDLPGLQSDKYFVLVHGYNVNGNQARGWHAEFFKRMFWSGSKARFVGVSWHGEESQGALLVPDITPNYHANVVNALQSGAKLATELNKLDGEKIIAGHSLGNMLISYAIETKNLRPSHYFPFNAAVAMECYDSDLASLPNQPNMTHPDWRIYDDKVFASEWHKLFEGIAPAIPGLQGQWDILEDLSWRKAFNNVPTLTKVTNFYSTGEEILNNAKPHHAVVSVFSSIVNDLAIQQAILGNDLIGEYTWTLQELLKGLAQTGEILGSTHGGWKVNFQEGPPAGGYWKPFGATTRPYEPSEAAALTDEQLRNKSFFEPMNLNQSFYHVIAEAVPARTYAVGRNPVGVFGADNNFDMMTLKNDWWSANPDPNSHEHRWLHGDIKDVSYTLTWRVYDKMKNRGELDK